MIPARGNDAHEIVLVDGESNGTPIGDAATPRHQAIEGRAVLMTRGQVIRRALLLVGLAVLAGAAAFYASSRATPVYERTVSLIVVPDVHNGPTDVSSEIVTTIAGGLGSRRFLVQSAEAALGHQTGPSYSLQAFVRPGSDIIDARLRGPSLSILSALANEYIKDSRTWTANHYAAYDLTFLESIAVPGPVSPHPHRMAAVGFVLGGLFGVVVLLIEVLIERRMRSRRIEGYMRSRRGYGQAIWQTSESPPVEDAVALRANEPNPYRSTRG